ncbi:MAG TPA: hypothetical protein VJY39_23800 [Acidisphaera sp.]|nr:hypothetical protein [Acidisphaera sp.]
MLRAVAAVTLSVLLAGCATQAQREAQNIRTLTLSAKAALDSCVASAALGHDDLAAHMPLNGNAEPSLQQLADDSRITPAETQSLITWHSAIEQCRHGLLADIQPTLPTIAVVLQTAYAHYDEVLVALMKHQISWGTADQQLVAVRRQGQEALMQASKEIVSQLQQADAAERAQRAAAAAALAQAAAAFSQAAQQQQLINQMNRPAITNCNRFGNMVNCTTY